MNIEIDINTDNAAFEPDPIPEVVRILRRLADDIEGHNDCESIRDINGNRVGTFVCNLSEGEQ